MQRNKLPPFPVAGRVAATRPMSKIAPHSTERTQAQPSSVPETRTGAGDNRTKFFTYQTVGPKPGDGGTPVLYSGDRLWSKVTMVLETAGPVSIGDSTKLFPVMGGQGILLDTNVPYETIIAKGTKLYIASTGVNRVRVKIEPLPWLEQITATVSLIADRIANAVASLK